LVALTIAFALHEYAHALAAYTLGDPTAKYEGRLTPNPLKHLDPLGSLVMLASMMMSGVVIGWAKPVPINENNLKAGYFDRALIAFAGPMINFILAFGSGLLCHLNPGKGPIELFLVCMIRANLGFGLFNLFPWPPLDGWKILTGLVPRDLGHKLYQFEYKSGMYALIALLLLSPILVNPILRPIFAFLLPLLTGP
jgi:Zn-dependent protease